MIESVRLSNGMTVVTEQMPHLRSAAFGIFIKVGSANETKQNNGIAHVIEHMLFKGTKNRSAKQIADETAAIGDTVNAFTTKEFTAYYGVAVTESLPVLLDILSDMVLHSTFEERALQKEKGVIAEEIDMYNDSPDDLVHELLQKKIWEGHPLGFLISGEKKTVRAMKRTELTTFFKQYYQPENMVVSVAGNFNREELLRQLEERFGTENGARDHKHTAERVLKNHKTLVESPYHRVYEKKVVEQEAPLYHKVFCTRKKDIGQLHMNLALPCIPYHAKERYCFAVCNSIFGGSNTSLLFQRIREEEGLAYSVYSYGSPYEKAGLFQVDVVMNPAQAERVLDLILSCMEQLKQAPVKEEVLLTHKRQARAELILGNESARNRMEANAKAMLMAGELVPFEETLDRLSQVTAEEVRSFAQQYFDVRQLSVCLVGETTQAAGKIRKRLEKLS